MKRAAVLFADGFEEVEAVTPLDFLRRAGISVVAAGVGGRDIVGAHDIRITTDTTVDELDDELDAVIIPGGMPGAKNIAASGEALSLIRKLAGQGKLIAAICAAPGVVLGKTGLLEGKRFTCFPGFEKDVAGGKFSEERVVRDGNLITSRGAGTAAEFALELISYLEGEEAARKIHQATLQK